MIRTRWLTGWKDIAHYMGKISPDTARRWWKTLGMPVSRSPSGKPQAKPEDLDKWRVQGNPCHKMPGK